MPSPQLERIAEVVANRVIAHLENTPRDIVPRRLTVKQAAQYLGISESAVYHLRARRDIPFVKHGKALGFLRDDLDRWLEGDRV
jgi:excisionase family DNA binding protein